MSCACERVLVGEIFLDSVASSDEFRKINDLLVQAASLANQIPFPTEIGAAVYHRCWTDVFKHHLKCWGHF
jgi:hypothetical protein